MNLLESGLVLGLLATLAMQAFAQPQVEPPLTLDAAVEFAAQSAPQVASRGAELDAARLLTTSAGQLPDPQLVLALDNLPVTGADAYSTTRDFMTMRRIGLMQEFPGAGRRRLERERAAAEATVAGAELEDTRLAVAREVADAWIRRSAALSTLSELRRIEPELKLQAQATRIALAASRGAAGDAIAAQAAQAQLAARIVRIEVEERSAALELARWIGAAASRPPAPIPDFDVLPVPPHELRASVHEHAALLPFDARSDAARLDLELARAARRPDWSAEIGYADRGADFSDMVSIEVRIGLPLFARSRKDPAIAASGAELRRIEADRLAELQMHRAELDRRLAEWELLGRQLALVREELLPLARERSHIALAAYRAGRGDLRAVTESRQDEIEALLELAALTRDRGRAWAYLRYIAPRPVAP